MQELYKFRLVLFLFLSFYFPLAGIPQVQTARHITTSSNSNGFYEYLPAGYTTGSQKYPLLIFIHGIGETGNGGSDLSKVLNGGPPRLIKQGQFPDFFTVNGNSFSFIVLSPQFIFWPNAGHVEAVIDYAIQHYRVNTNRIYLTGLSMGGGAVWDYASNSRATASKLAAILPISGASSLNIIGAMNIAMANLPVFAAHNLNDPIVPSANTINNIFLINSLSPATQLKALDTIYNIAGHDAWSTTYDPAKAIHNGLNAYKWLLQYSLGSTPLPVTVTDYKATLLHDNSRVSVSWTTAIEESNKYFILQRSANGLQFNDLDTIPAAGGPPSGGHRYEQIDPNPLYGDNFYRLTQVDIDGKTTLYGILKVTVSTQRQSMVRISPNPATGSTVYLELAYPEEGTTAISLSDVQGRILRTWQFRKEGAILNQYLDLSNLPPGNYFIDVQGATMHAVRQLIKK